MEGSRMLTADVFALTTKVDTQATASTPPPGRRPRPGAAAPVGVSGAVMGAPSPRAPPPSSPATGDVVPVGSIRPAQDHDQPHTAPTAPRPPRASSTTVPHP